jgi:hypothetical protein
MTDPITRGLSACQSNAFDIKAMQDMQEILDRIVTFLAFPRLIKRHRDCAALAGEKKKKKKKK